jgi:hypothetical protein
LSRQGQRDDPEQHEDTERDQPRTRQHRLMLSADGTLCTVATPVCVVLA